MRLSTLALAALLSTTALAAHAQTPADPLHVYGPGGPAPAMREAAKAYEARTGRAVAVVAGPTPQWLDQAKADGDLIFSGSETMMTDFVSALEGRIRAEAVEPLYLRTASILVRPGNPNGIGGLEDLFQPGRRVLVVNGAGQNGLWEDMAGRTGDIAKVRALRRNIVVYARNSAEARQAWIDDPTLDAWIIWGIWQVANPDLADVVEVEEPYRIYRDAGAVVTETGHQDADAQPFLDFLKSDEGAAIFARWGWRTGQP
ncbi:substrate-binding domain-containing protein [Brevundimonas nasdae]|uniref:substrate-binding domain-containing protein n=1 Tax=Brevundimonas nasdae TaxID=172043 RepID=UPI003F68EBE0